MANAEYVIITGLCRKIPEFLEAFSAATCDLEHRPEFIFSTWSKEANENPDSIKAIEAAGISVVTQPEPNLVMTGHLVHQLQALMLPLRFIPDDAITVRTRTDYFQPLFFRVDTLERDKYTIDGAISGIPFSINDMNFASSALKLRKLCAVPLLYDVQHAGLQTEQMIWGHQFEFTATAAHTVLRRIRFEEYRVGKSKRDRLPDLTRWDMYLFALQEYYRELLANFGFVRGTTNPLGGIERADTLWDGLTNASLPGVHHHPAIGLNRLTFMDDVTAMLALVEKQIEDLNQHPAIAPETLYAEVQVDPTVEGWAGWHHRARLK